MYKDTVSGWLRVFSLTIHGNPEHDPNAKGRYRLTVFAYAVSFGILQ